RTNETDEHGLVLFDGVRGAARCVARRSADQSTSRQVSSLDERSERMMFRNLGVHLALLGVAAGLAWASAQRPDDGRKPLEVELWSAKPEAVTQIRFKDAQREVVLTPREDGNGRYL